MLEIKMKKKTYKKERQKFTKKKVYIEMYIEMCLENKMDTIHIQSTKYLETPSKE